MLYPHTSRKFLLEPTLGAYQDSLFILVPRLKGYVLVVGQTREGPGSALPDHLLQERVRAFMARPHLSCGLRAQLAAVGDFSPQVASSSVVAAWSAFGHASVVTGALAVSMLHSRRGLRPRQGRAAQAASSTSA